METWQSLLIHGVDFEVFALFQILAFERPSDNVNQFFKLCNSEVYSVVHHLAKGFETFGWNVEQQNLRAWDVCAPIKLVSFVAADNENVALVDHYDLAFTDFLVVDFETRPLQPFKIVECMLIKLCEVKQLLRNGLAIVGSSAACSLRLVHRFQMLVLLLCLLQLCLQILYTIMSFLFRGCNHTHV